MVDSKSRELELASKLEGNEKELAELKQTLLTKLKEVEHQFIEANKEIQMVSDNIYMAEEE